MNYLWVLFSTSENRQTYEWVSERRGETRAEWQRVCTDLLLLNSSRFNQQIIHLIKWHPLLGQEPARSMRISQAPQKIDIILLPHILLTLSRQCHQTNPTLHCLLPSCEGLLAHWDGSPWNRCNTTLTPQPPEANTGRDRKTRPRSWAIVQNTQWGERTREGKSTYCRISPASTQQKA